jgi:HPt (histidine-containing phosphotransfer) domain-containing protein
MPTTDAAPSNPIFTRLRELELETDFDFVLELIDIYLDETPKQIQALSSALTAQTFPTLMIVAHTLKGSSLNLGAKDLGALCLKLEEIGRVAKTVPAGTNVGAIENEFARVKSTLLEFKQRK